MKPLRDDVAALAKRLGVTSPLVQAPMAGVQDSKLAIATGGAGALGSIPAAMLSTETLATEMQALNDALDHHYNVNFFCHRQIALDAASEHCWRQQLTPYYNEFGISAAGTDAAVGNQRQPFNPSSAELVETFRPAVVSFHFGLPETDLLQRVRLSGAVVLASATTLAEGRYLARQGVDAIIAQGLEAGGHRGMFLSEDLNTQLGTLALVRQLVTQLDVPIIAAGGIGDAAGVSAALALGASGVQAGTAYLTTDEASTSALHRAALARTDAQTVITNVMSGRPARGLVNRVIRETGPLSEAVPPFPHASAALAPLRAHAEKNGSADFSPLWAGQYIQINTGPAADLSTALIAGFTA